MSDELPQEAARLAAGLGEAVPGTRIAGYLLQEQIGRGGMAVVFRAEDERLSRQVALKILAPSLSADDAFRKRFSHEARAAAAVDHPHIIPVFEAGQARQFLFIAMRYVSGGDVLTMVSRNGPLAARRAAAGVISPVASALDAAHARGLVHRDVKPANMLLDVMAGRPDHVYLSDFGLSKASLVSIGLTGTGVFLGTPNYSAPEQIDGKVVDGRTDQYALACAAFEILCGEPPFKRDDGMAVMYAHQFTPPPAITLKQPTLLPAVDQVFARALAKDPAERFGSCREFGDALRVAIGMPPYHSEPGDSAVRGPQTEIAVPSARRPVPPKSKEAVTNVSPPAGTATWGMKAQPQQAEAGKQGPKQARGRTRPKKAEGAQARPRRARSTPAKQGAGEQAGPEQAAGGEAGPPLQAEGEQAGPAQAAGVATGPPPQAEGEQAGPKQAAGGEAGPEVAAGEETGLPRQAEGGRAAPKRARGRTGAKQAAGGEAGPEVAAGEDTGLPRQAEGGRPAPTRARGRTGPKQAAGGTAGPEVAAGAETGPKQAGGAKAGPEMAAAEETGLPRLAEGGRPAPRRARGRTGPKQAAGGTAGPEVAAGAETGPKQAGGAKAAPKVAPGQKTQPKQVGVEKTGATHAVGGPVGSAATIGVAVPLTRRRRGGWLAAAAAVVVAAAAGGVALSIAHAHAPARPHRGLAFSTAGQPRCPETAASAPVLKVRATSSLPLNVGSPSDAVTTHSGDHTFVSLGASGQVAVLGNAGPELTPRGMITLPGAAYGETLLNTLGVGPVLLVAGGAGASVIDVNAAIHRRPHQVLGQLTARGLNGAVQVAVAPDGLYAFVLYQQSNTLAVFNLTTAANSQFHNVSPVREVKIPIPDAMAFSRDNRWMYVVSEDIQKGSRYGAVSVLSLPALETDNRPIQEHTALAGCSPRGVIASTDGKTVWVTAKGSNELLGYSAQKLRSDPMHALIGKVPVGPTPIGLTEINNSEILVAAAGNVTTVTGTPGLYLVSTANPDQPALLGYIRMVGQPREIVPEGGGRLLVVSDNGTDEVLLLTPAKLP